MLPNNTSNLGQTAQPTGNVEERIDVRGTPLPVTRISRRAILLTGVFGASLGLVVLMLGFGDCMVCACVRTDLPTKTRFVRRGRLNQ